MNSGSSGSFDKSSSSPVFGSSHQFKNESLVGVVGGDNIRMSSVFERGLDGAIRMTEDAFAATWSVGMSAWCNRGKR